MRLVRLLLSIALVAVWQAGVSARATAADELIAPDRPIEEAVDYYVDAGLAAAGVTSAPPADDANFIRRVTLDLAGRIPTSSEVLSYLQTGDADKRLRLIDRLLCSHDFAVHPRNE